MGGRLRAAPGRWTLATALLLVVALVVTDSDAAADGDSVAGSSAFTAPFADGLISVEVQPATVGPNQVHAYVTDGAGRPRAVSTPRLSLTRGGDHRAIDLTTVGTGHLLGAGRLPGHGTYGLVIDATVDDEVGRARGTVAIAPHDRGIADGLTEWYWLQLSRS
ncbi:hypothetical protein BH23ACT10_BH23ACT10_03070 [soil metagenome]